MTLNLKDVRAEMPNYENYKDWQRDGQILGVAVHHSATADHTTGAPSGSALAFFEYHVNTRGWSHGGYNYVIRGNGLIEYALDEKIAAYHAGFKDPDDSQGLEQGQYWNNHYLAICLAGWFENNRTYQDANGQMQPIPNAYTTPTEAQMDSLLGLIQQLRQKYTIPLEDVRGHRELAGNSTACPGLNLDPAQLRAKLKQLDETAPAAGQPDVQPGEHVLLLPDADKYLSSALTYLWKFRPDVSFAVDEARSRWKYIIAAGDEISSSQMALLRSGGALLVQHIPGDPKTVQAALNDLVKQNQRFLSDSSTTPAAETWRTYTVQPGDTLSLIAKQLYGRASLWPTIFEANRDILSDPGRLHAGQVLKIPPKQA
jgi:N-acetyl-anhydromuramyl-L-alanine amidase AmpD